MTFTYKIVLILTILAISLRFIKLDAIPTHLSRDEIALGYNAYSMLQTGHDEHNRLLPVSFKSYGDYKAPLAVYLTVPTILLLGNNEYSARLPSAIFGSLTIIFLGLLVYEMTNNFSLSLLSSFLLSITPWHIYTSRMALETNIALFFVTLGTYLLFHGFNRNNKFTTILSFTSFALSLYAYHTEKIFTPLLIGLFFYFYRKTLKKPVYLIGIILFFLLVTPIIVDAYNTRDSSRAATQILFNDPGVFKAIGDSGLNPHQKGQVLVTKILSNYSAYTNLNFLFFNGLHLLPNNDPLQVGLFLWPLLPLFFIGLVHIKKFFSAHYKFIYSWLLVAPLVPSATIGEVNMLRDLVAIIPYTLAIAAGVMFIWKFLEV